MNQEIESTFSDLSHRDWSKATGDNVHDYLYEFEFPEYIFRQYPKIPDCFRGKQSAVFQRREWEFLGGTSQRHMVTIDGQARVYWLVATPTADGGCNLSFQHTGGPDILDVESEEMTG